MRRAKSRPSGLSPSTTDVKVQSVRRFQPHRQLSEREGMAQVCSVVARSLFELSMRPGATLSRVICAAALAGILYAFSSQAPQAQEAATAESEPLDVG